MTDTLIPKPPSVSGYATHRLVAGLTDGQPALHSDQGDHLLLRTSAPVPEHIKVFTLKASVSKKVKGRHRYFPVADWRSRREWLDRKAQMHGFEVITVHIEGGMQRITTHDGRDFTMDATLFTGALKVTDPAKFEAALKSGIGSTGKAFGLGMLIL